MAIAGRRRGFAVLTHGVLDETEGLFPERRRDGAGSVSQRVGVTVNNEAMQTPEELFDLRGQVAVVTGGSRGIGRAIAEGLASAGADVVIASRKLENCEAAAGEIAAATGRRAVPVACHVGQWDDCDNLADAVYREFGRCDVLVNNAGMSPAYSDLACVGEDLYDKVQAINT